MREHARRNVHVNGLDLFERVRVVNHQLSTWQALAAISAIARADVEKIAARGVLWGTSKNPRFPRR